MDDIGSPQSQDSLSKVRGQQLIAATRIAPNRAQPYKLDTMLPIRSRADSDDAPQSVIHAPVNFKTFVRLALALHRGCTT